MDSAMSGFDFGNVLNILALVKLFLSLLNLYELLKLLLKYVNLIMICLLSGGGGEGRGHILRCGPSTCNSIPVKSYSSSVI